MTEPRQRRPVSVRISVTDRCQLRCAYCMPPGGIPVRPHEDILSFEEIVRFVRELQSGFDLRKVRITGGEPLVRRGIVNLVAMLAGLHLRDLALTTNGQRLPEMAADLKRAGLHRVNVSLDSVSPAVYRSLTRGGDLEKTLNGIQEAIRVGLAPVKTNTVVVRGVNDGELPDIVRFALANGCHARFLELMPIGPARTDFAERFVPAAEVRAKIEASFQLTPIRGAGAGASSRDFMAEDGSGRRGTVGFIESESRPFCSGCTRLRLTSTGELVTCLARQESVSIREVLRVDSREAGNELRRLVAAALGGKSHRAAFASGRLMAAVGG